MYIKVEYLVIIKKIDYKCNKIVGNILMYKMLRNKVNK